MSHNKPYKHGKRGAGRFVQLHEFLLKSEAWQDLKPGPRALYVELKRRYNGGNNGEIFLSHRDAARALNVHHNTVGAWFCDLQERGFIQMTQGPYLGPSGIGQASKWVLEEYPAPGEKRATKSFMRWQKQNPRTKTVTPRHKNCDAKAESTQKTGRTVTKIVTQKA